MSEYKYTSKSSLEKYFIFFIINYSSFTATSK